MSTATDPVQYLLFDVGLSLSALRISEERLMQCSKAKNTILAYDHRWKMFCAWCERAGRHPFPASVETLKLYVAWSVDVRGYRLETVKLTLTAINQRHRDLELAPPVDEEVRDLVRSCARHLREQPRGKAAMTVEQLARICRAGSDRPIDLRDRALILVGFACAGRRSELSALDYPADVEFSKSGVLLWQRFGKTDQEGKGRAIGISFGRTPLTCPVRALRAWLDVRGEWAGPLFVRFTAGKNEMQRERLGGCGICHLVKRWIKRAGADPDAYGAHSVRAGMATAASEAGASDMSIMRRGGWKSQRTLLRYFRPAQAFTGDPLANVL